MNHDLFTEGFSFDLAEIESAVILHKVDDFVELLVYEDGFVRDYSNSDDGAGFAVIMVDFGNRDIESALESADNAFDDASFLLERTYPVQVKPGCH